MIDTSVSILIVDDMAPMRAILTSNLRTLGFKNIKAVSSAQEAINVLTRQAFDLVLTDWNMPEMTGIELLHWIRTKSENNRFTPVILITAEVKREQIEKAISSGVTDFILKPFNVHTLIERIQKALLRGEKRQYIYAAENKEKQQDLSKTMEPSQEGSSNNLVSDSKKHEEVIDDRTSDSSLFLKGIRSLDKSDPSSFYDPYYSEDRLTVLAVDDMPDNLTLISNLLKKDYRVKIASTGEKALRICNSAEPPDLVLLDIMMPGMDGYEVIRKLKTDEITSQIPVIFITALNDPQSIVKGLEAGAVDYITKPFEPSVLMVRVKNILRYHRGYKELKDTVDTMIENARLKEDVDHIIRHDMKGPLSAIISIVEYSLLKQKVTIENLTGIEESAYNLLNMVNLSTDLYKMEKGQFKLMPKPVNILRTIGRVTREIGSTFSSKNIAIENNVASNHNPEEFIVSGDEMLCYSLLYNLVRNAAEASPVGGVIDIKMAKGEGMIKISIHNEGAVPEPIRDRFFEKYVTWGKEGGTGLGTYSARLITEAQNGTISMNSSKEEGTTISLTLPSHKI